MATKSTKPKPSSVPPSDTLRISDNSKEEQAVVLAKNVLRPSLRAAVTTKAFSKPTFGDVDLTTLVDELGTQATAAQRGDMARAEAMLIAQAHTLDAMFHELARRAGANMGEYLNAAETYMRLALKSQSQCRATLEALAAIKNPPASVAFVRQANIAHGPQQVNNGPDIAPSRARETENAPNKLLEATNGQRLDTGAATQASAIDTQLEAVGALDRATNSGREGKG